MCGILGRIDLYTIAIHDAVACLANPLAADLTVGAFMIAAAAVIDIIERINRITGTVGHACSGHTGVIFAD